MVRLLSMIGRYLLDFLRRRGCHGVLLLGTTGEGPSFSPVERLEMVKAIQPFRSTDPEFYVLVGTGTPSLDETISLNRAVFEHGVDAVVVLPPYYFRKAGENGLFEWYSQVIQKSVPAGEYHFYLPHPVYDRHPTFIGAYCQVDGFLSRPEFRDQGFDL